jgi:transmembrane sensor
MNDELIEKYFKGLCTPGEAVSVLKYLKENPGHPYLLKEWEDADQVTPLPGNYTQEMYDVVEAYIKKTGRGRVKILWRISAAACIVLAVVSFWTVSTKHRAQSLRIAATAVRDSEWIEQKNTTDTAMVLVLADSSAVTLFPEASIRYHNNFGKYTPRNIYMSGEAYFEVAKNKAKPFTVYSGYIGTTALGTAFRVLAPVNGSGIKVRLNEGKVVVVMTDTAYKKMHPDYYLLPGQELVFSAKDKPGTIHTFIKHKMAGGTVAAPKQLQQPTNESYIFNNQTLADVLDQLAIIYQVKISYAETDIGTIYFIGKIEKNDPVEKIMADIASLNKLKLKKQNGGFILSRTKH